MKFFIAICVGLSVLPSAAASYPYYCSKMNADVPSSYFRDMPRIPELDPTIVASSGAKILSASALIRHGARTPYESSFCWSGYHTDESQYVWDCSNSIVMTTAPTSSSTYTSDSNLLFKKVYDALTEPLANELDGTCHVGQLIEEGVKQETRNGEQLRSSYVGDGDLKLFSSDDSFLQGSGSNGIPRTHVKFRGDDQQRTLQSGQLLVEALFPTTEDQSGSENVLVDWHTSDYGSDPIYPNSYICPKLTELQNEATSSSEFIAVNTSASALKLNSILDSDLGGADWRHILDCQMTSICTDRSIPSSIDDFGADDDDSIFTQIYDHASWQLAYVYQYNNNAHAKLSMAPVLKEVLETSLTPSLTSASTSDMLDKGKPLLSIYSGHDTTIMPILSALNIWDGAWAPYASLITIETYHVTQSGSFPTGRAFRICYNGEAMTEKFGGCEGGGELCDLNVLVDYLDFATFDRDCEVEDNNEDNGVGGGECEGKRGMSTPAWIFVCFILMSAASVTTAFVVTGSKFQAWMSGDKNFANLDDDELRHFGGERQVEGVSRSSS
ncbi:hypothetical protein TrLO_g8067 [Triparma laevis f. longispina]|uniref:Acid phosphatase n=1 Tax=Triparma laevis f. longispina TaxID=1714387 RepID=A0A9W6ZX54_9STRA|nr:hypothetical protein TrLO_g8067 [Triparma laevis f. longispina]